MPPELLTDRGESAGDSAETWHDQRRAGLTVNYRKVNQRAAASALAESIMIEAALRHTGGAKPRP